MTGSKLQAATMQTITDPRTVFTDAVRLGGSVVAAVRPDQLDAPTPCGDYNVRQLLGHLVAVVQRVAVLGEGGDGMSVPAEVTGVADDGWLAAWDAAAADAEKAW